jgi:hypothetical protein
MNKKVCKARNELEDAIRGFIAFQIIHGEGWEDKVSDAFHTKWIFNSQIDNQTGEDEYLVYKNLIRQGFPPDNINGIIIKKKIYNDKGYVMNGFGEMVENNTAFYYANKSQLKNFEMFRKREKEAELEEVIANREAEEEFLREMHEEEDDD